MRKIHIVSICIHIPTRNDCIHKPNNVPSSIASSCASKSGIRDSNRRDVSETMIPDALFTIFYATSNTAMTIFHVFVTIRTEQAVLNIHL